VQLSKLESREPAIFCNAVVQNTITNFFRFTWFHLYFNTTGPRGFQGPSGHRGFTGPPGRNGGGVEYIRWGRTSCPYGADKVYKG